MKLEVGTIEELNTASENRVGTSILTEKGDGSGRPPQNRGGGGSDDDSQNQQQEEKENFKPDTYRVGMGLILLMVLMTFGCLIGAYIVIATNRPLEWRTFEHQFQLFGTNLPFQVWISTALIIASSIDYELAKKSLLEGNQAKARKWFFITAILGAIFIASQVLAWLTLVNQGYYASGNPYAGLFYILTAVHAVHVVGGIISLVFIVLKTQITTSNSNELSKRQWFAKVVGWYWHFMGALWIVLFLLFGFYK